MSILSGIVGGNLYDNDRVIPLNGTPVTRQKKKGKYKPDPLPTANAEQPAKPDTDVATGEEK